MKTLVKEFFEVIFFKKDEYLTRKEVIKAGIGGWAIILIVVLSAFVFIYLF